MKRAIAALLLALAACPAWASGLSPWTFGMSRAQVGAFAEQGPYKAFANGDLETYAGEFDGVKRNVQFYFNSTGLWRISVMFYEGTDAMAARVGWKAAHATLMHLYGPVDVPLVDQAGVDIDALSRVTAQAVEGGAKVQMAPARQPREEYLFSSWQRSTISGRAHYRVVVYLDPPHAGPALVAQLEN